MFESFISNLKRTFSKNENIRKESIPTEKPKFKNSSPLFKIKTLSNQSVIEYNKVENNDNIALSPRAIGAGECATTEIEWPLITDNNPNILDKFTRIISIVDHGQYPVSLISTHT